MSSTKPAEYRSIPAQAIMAALSVQYFKGGDNKVKLCFCAIFSNSFLINVFDVTPTATAKFLESVDCLNIYIDGLAF